MSWDNDMQDMLGGLQRARYVETRPAYGGHPPRKSSASFRPDILATTDLGSEYLDTIQKAQKSSPGQRHHATKKRKTAQQLEHEIAQNLSAQGQPKLAAMFADPQARKTFAREMRHEIQKQQLSRVSAEARAVRPFTVKRIEERGGHRSRDIFGNYATEVEARAAADRVGGWVETRDGRVVYGAVEKP